MPTTSQNASLFEPERHHALDDRPWDEREARTAIDEVAADAIAAFDPERLWPIHPADGAKIPIGGLYFGAAGVIWALDYLKRSGTTTRSHDFTVVLPSLMTRDTAALEAMGAGACGSLLMGDLGPMLVAMRLKPERDLADRIFVRATGNNALPPLELMWGTPGSMLACVFMHGMTGEPRWETLYREQATRLLAALHDVGGFRMWKLDFAGPVRHFPGLVHGFAGNIAAFFRGWYWLTAEQQETVQSVAVETLRATALHDSDGANWPVNLEVKEEPMLCQLCHGAPGIVTALAAAPFASAQLDQLLEDGGRLTWHAGALTKGANLCHGTAGNGYALLMLYRRTGDALWLDRARQFAMTAIRQMRQARAEHGFGRYSLWTGDPGTAIYLWDCIRAEAAFPTLAVF